MDSQQEIDDILEQLSTLAAQWRSRGSAPARSEQMPLAEQFLAGLDRLYALGWDYALGWRSELPDEYLPARYLERRAAVLEALEDELAYLAMAYRGSETDQSESAILADYERVMNELFHIGHWSGEPDAESQLPRQMMPQVYREYWRTRMQGTDHSVTGGV